MVGRCFPAQIKPNSALITCFRASATVAMTADDPIPALMVRGVGHAYGRRRALDGVSFAVPAGAFTVLLGLNGAGKSTLFALVTRLYDAREGTIEVFGHDVSREPGEALR